MDKSQLLPLRPGPVVKSGCAAQRHLVIMAKLPEMGRVKTRLAKGIGAVAATGFYRIQLTSILRRLGKDNRWRTWVAVAPDTEVTNPFWPRHVDCFGQGGGDLGQRMATIIHRMPPGPVIIVGSDIPGLSQSHIAAGFERLGGHDAVFGPAPDGGYYLVGLKRNLKSLDPFGNVRWSTSHALEDTCANLKGRSIAYLGQLQDVDTAEDLVALKTVAP